MQANGKTVIYNFLWRFGERITAQFITFFVSIILARIIAPSDYGAVAIIIVVINLANVIVNNGFATALIQKKDADDIDFSSVFYFTLCFSLLIYILLYIVAPLISDWYSLPILAPTLRVLGLRIIIGAVNSVQQSYVSRHMMFKKFFWSTLGGTIASAIIGIILAYSGFGVWAIVMQYLINTTVDTIVLWFTVKWRPKIVFSFLRLKELIGFGWKLLASALLGTIYDDLRALIIGKVYTTEDLAFYSKGSQFPSLIMKNVNTSVTSVSFPILSQLQDNYSTLAQRNKRLVNLLTLIISPLLFGLAALAEPLVSLILTDKWLPCVIYIRLWCIFYLISSLYTTYLQSFKAIGKSGLSLTMELIDDIIGIILVIQFFRIGVVAISIVTITSRAIAMIVSMAVYSKIFHVKLIDQVKDISKPITISVCMSIAVFFAGKLPFNCFLLLAVQVFVGLIFYCIVCFMFKLPEFMYLLNLLKVSFANKIPKG